MLEEYLCTGVLCELTCRVVLSHAIVWILILVTVGHALHDDGVEIALFYFVNREELFTLYRNIVREFLDRYLLGALLYIVCDFSLIVINRHPVGNFSFNRNSFF